MLSSRIGTLVSYDPNVDHQLKTAAYESVVTLVLSPVVLSLFLH